MEHKWNIGNGIALIVIALSLLLLPLSWIIAVLLAIAVHESCHYIAIRLCGGNINRLSITLTGVEMEIGSLHPLKEFICAAAGPLGGLALLLLARFLPRTALCGAFQAIYNLLPVYPLDGGRMLYSLSRLLLPPRIGEWICRGIEIVCVSGILILGFYGTIILQLGLFPLIIAGILTQRAVLGKIACKASSS